MKGKNFTKIIIAAFIAAGILCIAVGLIVYFSAKSSGGTLKLAIGICATAVGVLDTLVALMALLLVFIKGALEKKFTEKTDEETDGKPTTKDNSNKN